MSAHAAKPTHDLRLPMTCSHGQITSSPTTVTSCCVVRGLTQPRSQQTGGSDSKPAERTNLVKKQILPRIMCVFGFGFPCGFGLRGRIMDHDCCVITVQSFSVRACVQACMHVQKRLHTLAAIGLKHPFYAIFPVAVFLIFRISCKRRSNKCLTSRMFMTRAFSKPDKASDQYRPMQYAHNVNVIPISPPDHVSARNVCTHATVVQNIPHRLDLRIRQSIKMLGIIDQYHPKRPDTAKAGWAIGTVCTGQPLPSY
ncbi:hypothetical protein BJV74DRAFT_135200 [Russula compacta]|nr:hypothetical protein BJV74DRAFT_135200 [Russula compacta]